MGLFFERVSSDGGDPLAVAIESALAVEPDSVGDQKAEAARRARAASGDAKVQAKPGAIGVGLVIAVVLLVIAFFLALWVDPQLIAQAEKAAGTSGYTPPDLQATKLSEAVQGLLVAWAGGLAGAILGDGVGTATAK